MGKNQPLAVRADKKPFGCTAIPSLYILFDIMSKYTQ
jgi:hypothetical protein